MFEFLEMTFDKMEKVGVKDIIIDEYGFITIFYLDNTESFLGTNDEKILKEFMAIQSSLRKDNWKYEV